MNISSSIYVEQLINNYGIGQKDLAFWQKSLEDGYKPGDIIDALEFLSVMIGKDSSFPAFFAVSKKTLPKPFVQIFTDFRKNTGSNESEKISAVSLLEKTCRDKNRILVKNAVLYRAGFIKTIETETKSSENKDTVSGDEQPASQTTIFDDIVKKLDAHQISIREACKELHIPQSKLIRDYRAEKGLKGKEVYENGKNDAVDTITDMFYFVDDKLSTEDEYIPVNVLQEIIFCEKDILLTQKELLSLIDAEVGAQTKKKKIDGVPAYVVLSVTPLAATKGTYPEYFV